MFAGAMTHVFTPAVGPTWFGCVPLASCLNRDGRHNGIVLVECDDGRLRHVGSRFVVPVAS